MSAWGGLAPHSGAVLIRQFAVLSFAIVGLITVSLCAVISYYFREDLLEQGMDIHGGLHPDGSLAESCVSGLRRPREPGGTGALSEVLSANHHDAAGGEGEDLRCEYDGHLVR